MDRKIEDKSLLDKFAEEFCALVENHTKYMIVSGFSAIASGRTRGTEDIDMIISEISEDKFLKMHEDFIQGGFECMQSANPKRIFDDYLKKGISVRYVWKEKFLPEMEIHFVKDKIDEYQMKKRIKMDLTGLNVWFAPIEGNIAFKEEWLKTDKDLEDAKHLRIVYAEKIDEEEINIIKEMIKRFRR